ncbi:hypothetical protein CH256_18755 [Rhodococcus sp. 05-2254-6]|nr:hypothetical protein CH256_18755 [Rhodococcus sp. 05-2254-6]
MGRLLPTEFASVCRALVRDATWILMIVMWADGTSTTIAESDKIEPVPDPTGIETVSIRSRFDDGSQGTLELGLGEPRIVADRGQALDRLTETQRLWESLPGRSNLSYKRYATFRKVADALWLAPLLAAIPALGIWGTSNTLIFLYPAFFVFGVAGRIALAATESHKHRDRQLVHARPQSNINWTLIFTAVGALAGLAGFILVLVRY